MRQKCKYFLLRDENRFTDSLMRLFFLYRFSTMPRNKKNKGNSGPAPNNNKAKSPAETKVVESTVTPIAAPLPVESDTSNEELKARLVNAKERLHLLQEVIGGIGDPTNVENFKASGIDAAKEKLNIIQDSVDSMKTTLLEVRQETTRSVTPEGSPSGTNKKRKNKKHQNQNPPQGFVVLEEPAADVAETKSKTDAPEDAGAAVEQDDGTTTISKKKRNRNRNKNKGQQEQSPAPESLPQESNVTVEAVTVAAIKIDEPIQATSKENSPDANQSKNNKKNNKKGQQKSTNEQVEVDTSVGAAAVKPADLNKPPPAEVKTENQPPSSNDKNKNKNKNKKADGNNKETEKVTESPAGDQQSKVQADANVKDSKAEKASTDVSKDTKSATKTKEDSPSEKESQKKGENVKDQQPKIKNDQKKGQTVEEKPAVSTESALPQSKISKAPEKEESVKAKTEPLKSDAGKNKKDKKKGQATDTKVEVKPAEAKVISDETSKYVVAEAVNIVTAPKIETVDVKPLKVETPKSDENLGKMEKLEDKTEKPSPVSITPIEEKNVLASHKNKKNKQQAPAKTAEKPEAAVTVEQAPKNVTDTKASEPVVSDVSKAKNEAPTPVVITKLSEKQERPEDAAPAKVQTEPKPVLAVNKEILKAVESPKLPVAEEKTAKDKVDPQLGCIVAPTLPKLDFSQVVKDNKDKIPLMEIKPLPVVAAEVVTDLSTATDSVADAAVKTTDSAIKSTSEIAGTEKPIIDAVKDTTSKATDIKAPSTAEIIPKLTADTKPTTDVASKVDVKPKAAETSAKSAADATKPSVDTSSKSEAKDSTPVPTATSPHQSKAKTPERKGNQSNQKNEQKKPQQGKGQCMKPKPTDQPAAKKEEVKQSETPKIDAVETKAVPEKSETKSETPAAIPTTEAKVKEEIPKKNENTKKEQGKQKFNESNVEVKSIPAEKAVPQKQLEAAEKQQTLIEDKAVKDVKKQPVAVAVESTKASGDTLVKDNKSVSASVAQSPSTNRQPEPQKQEPKTELSKKDQKKQNKMKGKAPQPPDIPMDMSLLSASMIDPAAADEIISHEESEDQSSLIASDSKNVAGSDFVQSVDSLPSAAKIDETKSLGAISTASKNENKVTEIEREAKNSSPSSSKRNKDIANLKESVEMQETKRQELPEKSAQQKLEPVQFPAVKLMDILEAKMTSPCVKPGLIAGNVRKLPKDNKRSEQLNVQQQKSRSKSPKENMAEKYVKTQKLASGDNKKQAAQNLKTEILKTDVGSLVTPINKEKEAKEPTIDAKLNESKNTSGTASITTAVTEAEQVVNSDATSKQKAEQLEQLPANSNKSDAKLQQSNDDAKTGVAAGGKKENVNTKPKVAPKPNVPSKTPPKTVDRSKKSPAKTPENKAAGKESPVKDTPVPIKSPAQAKPSPPSKSPAKQPVQTKSPAQSKTAPAPTAAAKPPTQISDAQSSSTKKPEVSPKPDLSKEAANKATPVPVQDDDEEFVEYKFSPRPVFISTACQICKVPLDIPNPCKLCQMVSYCSAEHEREDQIAHGPLCAAIQEIAKKRGE